MKKFLLIIFTVLFLTSCSESPKEIIRNQEVEIFYTGYKNTRKVQFKGETYLENKYVVEVKYNNKIYDITDEFICPELLDLKVGQRYLAKVYLYVEGDLRIIIGQYIQ